MLLFRHLMRRSDVSRILESTDVRKACIQFFVKWAKERKLEYQGDNYFDPAWKKAYEVLMPRRVLWYDEQIRHLTKKIEFMEHMTPIVHDKDNMRKKIAGLNEALERVKRAHDLCMSKVYASVGGPPNV